MAEWLEPSQDSEQWRASDSPQSWFYIFILGLFNDALNCSDGTE
jgi:hypothetical protein